jgi:iron complex outermembrane receptor protein
MYGKTSEGDGSFKQSDLFLSLPLEYDGFFNISAEFRDRSKTNRAGVDERVQYPDGDSRNSLPSIVRTEFGEPDAIDKLVTLNSEIVARSGAVFYMHGLYDGRDSKAGAFFRRAVDDRNNINIYPDGFLPKIAPKIEDYSFTLGSKGVMGRDLLWDLSYTRGYNDFHFFVKNTLNSSLGDSSPTSFDSGGTKYAQDIVNLDLSKKIGSLNLAAGVEYRKENYRIYSGEEGSYILGSYSDYAGAQGFPGFQPQNEVDKNRHNAAAYIDLKYEINRDLTLGVASRYENYSDFGSTLNEKISATYKLTPDILLRSSASTGFRAPSLTQAYYTSTVSMMVDYELYQAGTFATDHPLSVALGAKELDAEKSKHLSLGSVYSPNSNLSLSLDYFYTKIDDRIMMSGEIYEGMSEDIKGILNNYNVNSARYFMNSADTKTNGVDLRVNYKHFFEDSSFAKFIASYQHHDTKVARTVNAPSILGESGDEILLDGYTISTIQDGQPKENIKIYMQYFFKDYIFALNLNRFGSYKSWDYKFGAKTITDVDLTYNINRSIYTTIGVENLFDVYPDTWGPSEMIPYSQHSPFGFSGAFYYFRAGVKF